MVVRCNECFQCERLIRPAQPSDDTFDAHHMTDRWDLSKRLRTGASTLKSMKNGRIAKSSRSCLRCKSTVTKLARQFRVMNPSISSGVAKCSAGSLCMDIGRDFDCRAGCGVIGELTFIERKDSRCPGAGKMSESPSERHEELSSHWSR
jgi:hypothetical protein